MNPLLWPWLEIAVAVPLLTALPVLAMRDKLLALRVGTVGCALAFVASFMAWLAQHTGWSHGAGPLFRIDELSAPLVPVIALLHLLMAMTTSNWKAESFGAARYLVSLALRLAAFSCCDPWLLVGLSLACCAPGFFDLRQAKKPTTVYLVHMVPFAALLTGGWALVSNGQPDVGAVLLILAVLIRSGVFPAHVWILDLIENGSFSSAVLVVTPMLGAYVAVRLAVPVAPPWLLTAVTLISLTTAVYSSGMAIVQTETRRFFGHLFVSFSSLVLVGLEVHTRLSVTGALALWFSVMISAGGLTVVLRAVEARHGPLSLKTHHGLYDRSPLLAVGFLTTALACVGFPGTLGFVSAEILIDGTIGSNLWVGLVVILVSGLNGIAVMRAYWLLFTGRRHVGASELPATWTERLALLVLAAAIFGGGLFPQPGLTSRFEASRVVVPSSPTPEH